MLSAEWLLPDGWSFAGGNLQQFMTYTGGHREQTVELTAGEFTGVVHIPVIFRLSGRNYPVYGVVTMQREGIAAVNGRKVCQEFWDRRNRRIARM